MTEQELAGQPESTPEQRWRKHRVRQILVFVTLPGILLGTATFSTAYSRGWLTPEPPKPACKPEMVLAPARSSFVVNVLNATGRDGMAASVAKGLSQRKFTVGGISNAPETWYITQPAVIHHGPAGLDKALLVQQQIPGAELFEDEGRGGKSVDVVVGLGYQDMVPLPPASTPAQRDHHERLQHDVPHGPRECGGEAAQGAWLQGQGRQQRPAEDPADGHGTHPLRRGG